MSLPLLAEFPKVKSQDPTPLLPTPLLRDPAAGWFGHAVCTLVALWCVRAILAAVIPQGRLSPILIVEP